MKIRIWDKKNKKWTDRVDLVWHQTYDSQGKHIFELKKDENLVFQQSTQLNDSTNKETFEGDIIEFDETGIGGTKGIGEVFYDNDMTLYGPCFCVWVWKCENPKPNTSGTGQMIFPFNYKIIGNIFENPELIKT